MDEKVEASETTISYETDRADHQKPVIEKPVTMEPVSGLGIRGRETDIPYPGWIPRLVTWSRGKLWWMGEPNN